MFFLLRFGSTSNTISFVTLALALALNASLFSGCKIEPKAKLTTNEEDFIAQKDFKKGTGLFKMLLPSQTGITFRNDIVDDLEMNPLMYVYAYNGGGVAAGDLDGDGLPELIFTSNQNGIELYRNKGVLKFEEVSATAGLRGFAGWFTGVTLVDINADGLLDVYVCRSGIDSSQRSNLLFINQGNLRFKEQASVYGLNDDSPSSQAYFFDYDSDGDIDVFIVNHPVSFENIWNIPAYQSTQFGDEGADVLYENNKGIFEDVSAQAGIENMFTFGLSASVADFNNDGLPDIYVANDFISPDQLYINNGNKTFTNKASAYFSNTSMFSMGSDAADLNGDDFPELMSADMLSETHFRQKSNMFTFPLAAYNTFHTFVPLQFIHNPLHINNDGKNFVNSEFYAGVARSDWSWNINFADFDNDGLKDIFVTNGIKREYSSLDFVTLQESLGERMGFRHNAHTLLKQMPIKRLRNALYLQQADFKFSDASIQAGMPQKLISNGAIYADLDADGDLEIVINNTDTVASVYKNLSTENGKNNFIHFTPKGDGLNTYGIGVRVKIFFDEGKTQTMEQSNSRGFHSCPQHGIWFGLNNKKLIDSITVTWQSGKQQRLYKIAANQHIILNEKNATAINQNQQTNPYILLQRKQPIETNLLNHKEGIFNDFKKDRLQPFKISAEGPSAIVIDVNKDGLDDFIVGGSKNGTPTTLFIQNKTGAFTKKEIVDNSNEITGIASADFNSDGYTDLLLTTGSNEFDSANNKLKPILLLNNKKEGFADASTWLPAMVKQVSSSPLFTDVNNDGLADILLFGRMVPSSYPSGNGRSYLLINTGKAFIDKTLTIFPELLTMENVTASALLKNVKQKIPDILIAEEWQPIKLFKSEKGKFKRKLFYSELDSLKGLWRSLKIGDVNGDKIPDILIGNFGLNDYLQASTKEPLALYFNDFDGNGINEPLLFHYLKGKSALLYDRNIFCEQMPKYRNKFLNYKSFAHAKIGDLIESEKMQSSKKYEATYLENTLLIGLQNRHYKKAALPYQFQLQPIYDWLITDFNSDGLPDIAATGGSDAAYYFTPNTTGYGSLISLNDGNNNFYFAKNSGFEERVIGRKILLLNSPANEKTVSFIYNNAPIATYSFK